MGLFFLQSLLSTCHFCCSASRIARRTGRCEAVVCLFSECISVCMRACVCACVRACVHVGGDISFQRVSVGVLVSVICSIVIVFIHPQRLNNVSMYNVHPGLNHFNQL